MLMSVFCVYDSAISTWMNPLFCRNKGEMLRHFIDAVNDPQSKFAKHPTDYVLFELGTWNDDSCLFDLLKAPVRLGVAMEFLKAQADSIMPKPEKLQV